MAKQDEPNKAIYSMVGVGKVYGQKQVLRDIYLGYFYGAKIGAIGLNGSGKSKLLRIMAGVETSFLGQVALCRLLLQKLDILLLHEPTDHSFAARPRVDA